MEYRDYAELSDTERTQLQRELEPLRTLGDLLDWWRRRHPPGPAPIVVTQDEYTHDVLLPYAAGRWLDFDTT